MGNGKFLAIKSGNYGIIGECQRPDSTALKSTDALAHKAGLPARPFPYK